MLDANEVRLSFFALLAIFVVGAGVVNFLLEVVR